MLFINLRLGLISNPNTRASERFQPVAVLATCTLTSGASIAAAFNIIAVDAVVFLPVQLKMVIVGTLHTLAFQATGKATW